MHARTHARAHDKHTRTVQTWRTTASTAQRQQWEREKQETDTTTKQGSTFGDTDDSNKVVQATTAYGKSCTSSGERESEESSCKQRPRAPHKCAHTISMSKTHATRKQQITEMRTHAHDEGAIGNTERGESGGGRTRDGNRVRARECMCMCVRDMYDDKQSTGKLAAHTAHTHTRAFSEFIQARL